MSSKLSKSEYQKAWRAAHPRDPEEVNAYMREYIANAESINCEICSGKYKTYAKYKHIKSQKHIAALYELTKAEKVRAEAEEARKQQEALAEAEAKREAEAKKPTPAPRKRKTKPEPEPAKPVPAPRKKAEPTKAEALRLLEEYGETTDEDESKPAEPKLADLSVKLQGKTINAADVAAFIDQHFAESANPDRPASSKTPRRNKNSSLWKKVANELDGRKFSYLGDNLGAIVARTYDKPSVQADMMQMLKLVILHFTKTPKAVEERIKKAVFDLKQAHVSKQK
jgi:hypothetical protein